jgi:hypothetical protein
VYDRQLFFLIHALFTIFDTWILASDDQDLTNHYPMPFRFREKFDDIIPRWRVTPLRAYHSNGDFIDVSEQETHLRGSLVLVTFKLRHYAIRNNANDGVRTNTFTATVTEVQILEPAQPQPTDYKSALLKGPSLLPQPSAKQRDQMRAVQAFHPGSKQFRFFFFLLSYVLYTRGKCTHVN